MEPSSDDKSIALSLDEEPLVPSTGSGGGRVHESRTVASAKIRTRLGFLRKILGMCVYHFVLTWITSAVALYYPGSKGLLSQWTWMLNIGLLATVVMLGLMWWKRNDWPVNCGLLILWGVCLAYTVGAIAGTYDIPMLMEVTFLVSCTLLCFFLYTCQVRRDFGGPAPWLFSLVLICCLGGVIQMFLLSEIVEVVGAIVGALLVTCWILWDLQRSMQRHKANEWPAAALNVYLDILEALLYPLRAVGLLKSPS